MPMPRTVHQVDTDVFTAIAHPVRRQLLDRLANGDHAVKTLAEPFELTRPAISQHLRILLDSGLVTEYRVGRERRYRLQAERLAEVRAWLQHYERFWNSKLDALGEYLEKNP
jgi:DNA-binding transcriptional ArsR family regulator